MATADALDRLGLATGHVFVIRAAGPQDAPALAELVLRSRRASVPAIPPLVHSAAEVHRWWATQIEAWDSVWVGESDSEVVGVLVRDEGWITQMYVDPEWTGRGLGSDLIAVAKRGSPEGLDLWTFQSNDGARRFYEQHGFTAVAETEGENEEGEPDIRYRWEPVER